MLYTKMVRERPQDVIERLTDQNDLLAIRLSTPQSVHGFFLQAELQKVFEVFFAEQVQPITSNAAEQHIQESSRASSTCQIGDGAKQRRQSHSGATPPTLGKTLCVPRKESDLAKGAQLQKGALDAPIDRRACGYARLNAFFVWRSL